MPIPLIGRQQTRGWLRIGLRFTHDNQSTMNPDQTVHLPSNKWQLTLVGFRSDNIKITRVRELTVAQASDPTIVATQLAQLSTEFETYLNCECSGRGACARHETDALVLGGGVKTS